jgi:hypothetical protein
MSATAVARALGDARREGGNWRCRCSLHGGCSLVLRDGSGGRLLATCWDGWAIGSPSCRSSDYCKGAPVTTTRRALHHSATMILPTMRAHHANARGVASQRHLA